MSDKIIHKVVCFGEVLWDVLSTGAEPGGAPMNVAYHLQKLNKNPALITRIGSDEMGADLINLFSSNEVCTEYFQIDYNNKTGIVQVQSNDLNEVIYDIIKPVAWDFISILDSHEKIISEAEYFIFGSLAARNDVSKHTLFQMLEMANYKVLDINLRAPHFTRQLVEELLQKSDLLKMNLNELELITSWFSDYNSIEDRIAALSNKYNLSKLVVTMGGNGAIFFVDDLILKHPGYCVEVVDTIGSGDAFLAGLLSQLMDKNPTETALEFANVLGAFVATKRGACPDYDIKQINEFIKNKRN